MAEETGDGCAGLVCHGCGQVHANSKMMTLPSGKQVGLQSEEWRHHCEVMRVMRMPDKARKGKVSKREYLELVRERRGDDAANRLRRDMVIIWRQQHEGK